MVNRVLTITIRIAIYGILAIVAVVILNIAVVVSALIINNGPQVHRISDIPIPESLVEVVKPSQEFVPKSSCANRNRAPFQNTIFKIDPWLECYSVLLPEEYTEERWETLMQDYEEILVRLNFKQQHLMSVSGKGYVVRGWQRDRILEGEDLAIVIERNLDGDNVLRLMLSVDH